MGLYRQQYCSCLYSEQERYEGAKRMDSFSSLGKLLVIGGAFLLMAGGFLLLLGKMLLLVGCPVISFTRKISLLFSPGHLFAFEYPFDIDCQSFSAPLKSIGITASQAALGLTGAVFLFACCD